MTNCNAEPATERKLFPWFKPNGQGFVSLQALFLVPTYSAAQAWVPARGEGTVTVTIQDNFVKDHFGSNGERLDVGHIRTFVLAEDVDFGITNKLAVDISLPFVLSKYYGAHPHQLPVDNGNYHGNFQDVRINLRYNFRIRPLAITPFRRLGCPQQRLHIFRALRGWHKPKRVCIRGKLRPGVEPVAPTSNQHMHSSFLKKSWEFELTAAGLIGILATLRLGG